MNKIPVDEFKKVEMKIGKILSAEKIPDTDKLLKLSVDFGDTVIEKKDESGEVVTENKKDIRQVVSGISLYFPEPEVLIGKRCLFATNLEVRKIRGFDSEAMIVAVGGDQNGFSLLFPNDDAREGMTAR